MRLFKLSIAMVALLAWDIRAQVDPPHVDNLVFEIEQEPVDSDGFSSAVSELYFSLIDGGPCNPQPGDPIQTIFELCDYLGQQELWDLSTHKYVSQIKFAGLNPILQELYDLMIDTDSDGWVDSEDAYPDDPTRW